MAKDKRFEVLLDVETLDYLREKSVASGAPLSELVRRSINMARFGAQQAAREGHAHSA